VPRSIDDAGVRYARREENTLLPQLLSWILPALIFFVVWAFFIRRMAERAGGPGGGLMAVGKSKAKVYVETFSDVAGVDEAHGRAARDRRLFFSTRPSATSPCASRAT
jgi:cell division protease FtsH